MLSWDPLISVLLGSPHFSRHIRRPPHTTLTDSPQHTILLMFTSTPFHMDPHIFTYFAISRLSIHVHSFRHVRPPIHHSTPIWPIAEDSTPDPIHSSRPDAHGDAVAILLSPTQPKTQNVLLPSRARSFMCNTVPYPYPFHLPPLLYSSILSRPFSLFVYYVHILYVVHGSYTRTVYVYSMVYPSRPKIISRMLVLYAPVSQIDYL